MEALEHDQQELILGFLAEGGEDYTSGEALSDKLGLSRTTVWKHVQSLRHQGYRIDAAPARGYRLVEVPDRLSNLELSPLLNTHEVGREIHYFDRVPSTNELAFGLAQDGAPHGALVIAEEQTSGKGRRGRSWQSPKGVNLYCSVVLRPELPAARAPELTLIAAVAVAETLADAGADAAIKWPNDLHVADKKIGGILTELSVQGERVGFVIVGIGVNLNARPSDFQPDVASQATSLAQALGHPVSRPLFTAALCTRLEQWLESHLLHGFGTVRTAWKKRACLLGEQVLVKSGQREIIGIARDLDEGGALLVETEAGVERVVAADVERVRPRAK